MTECLNIKMRSGNYYRNAGRACESIQMLNVAVTHITYTNTNYNKKNNATHIIKNSSSKLFLCYAYMLSHY